MNSKDEAKELVDKFSTAMQKADMYGDYDIGEKEFALIAVNEILKHCYEVMKPFWQEVKQEIELL